MKNWTSKGFIYSIAQVPLRAIHSRAEKTLEFEHNVEHNFSNSNLFDEVEDLAEDDVNSLFGLLEPILFDQQDLKPTKIDGLFRELRKEKAADFQSSSSSAYNQGSSVEFHCLLMALLVGYVKALNERDEVRREEGMALLETQSLQSVKKPKNLKKGNEAVQVMRNKSKEEQERLDGIHLRIWKYGRILWTLTSSRMFNDHLRSLQGLLATVSSSQMSLYSFFGSQKLEVKQSGSLGAPSTGDGDGEEEEEGTEKEDVEEEQMRRRVLVSPNTTTEAVDQFKSWMKMITSHFSALNRLTRTRRNEGKAHMKAALVITKRCRNGQSLAWPELIRSFCCKDESLLTTTFPSKQPALEVPNLTEEQAENAIKLLQAHIDRNRDMFSAFGSDAPSFNQGNKKKGTVLWTGKQHCEGIAASLFKYPELAISEGAEDIRSLISVRTFPVLVTVI